MMTNEALHFIRFRTLEDKGWDEAWNLYMDSFPQNERWSKQQYEKALRKEERFHADGIWLGEKLVGLLFYWEAGAFHFLEHLAVKVEMRGRRLGSRIMEKAIEEFGQLVLEIDPPVDSISIRRLRFYEALGLKLNDYGYRHPSYQEPFKIHPLKLMSYPEKLSRSQAEELARFVREENLKYSDHVNPNLPRIE